MRVSAGGEAQGCCSGCQVHTISVLLRPRQFTTRLQVLLVRRALETTLQFENLQSHKAARGVIEDWQE